MTALRYWFASLLLLAPAAQAQTTPTEANGLQLAARRTLLERAQAAARLNNHALALSLAQQAAEIETTPSLRMFLAQQLSALGRHGSAMEQAEFCLREATRNTTLERRDTILAECRRLSAVSQGQVVLLTIRVVGPLRPDIAVRVGPRLLAAGELNVPFAIDPGETELTVTAADVAPHREAVHGASGAVLTVVLPARFTAAPLPPVTREVHSSDSHAPPNANTQTTVAASTTNRRVLTPAPATARPASVGFASRVGPGAWTLFGSGLVSFAMAGVFWGLRESQFTHCHPDGDRILCDSEQAALQWRDSLPGAPDPYTYTSLAQGAIALGSALAAGGTVWMIARLAAPQQRTEFSRATVAFFPVLNPQQLGGGVAGAF